MCFASAPSATDEMVRVIVDGIKEFVADKELKKLRKILALKPWLLLPKLLCDFVAKKRHRQPFHGNPL
jgi:hypothetical protein